MRFFIFRESIQAEDGQDIHILVIDHQPNVTQAASGLESVLRYFAPQDQIDEDFGDLFQRLKIYVFGP